MSWQPIYDDKGFSQGHRASIREITQRKEAEEALRTSEQMLQLVLDTIPVRVFWKDRDSVFIGCNSLFAKDAGLTSPEEIVGKTDYELGWKEQADLYRSDDALVIKTGEAKLYYEEPQTTPDGKRIWLRTSKIPLRDLDGNIIGVMGTYEDITERKRSEDALRLIVEGTSGATGEEFFRCLVKALASAFGFRHALVGEVSGPKRDRIRTLAVWTDKDFAENFKYRLAGTPCETVVGQRLCLYPEGVQEKFPEDHLLVDLGVESYLGAPLFGSSGEALGLLAVMDDKPMGSIQHAEAIMTIFGSRATAELERELVSRALARGEKRFRSVVETASDAIISADSSGKIIFWNSAAEKMFGYSPDEIIRKPLTKIMPKRYRHAHSKGLNRVVTTGKTRLKGKVVELVALKKDGSEFPVSLSVASWATEEGLFFTAIIRDITERKGAEEALRQSEERYRNVYDTAPLAFVVWDRTCSISGWNKRAEEVFGWSQEEVKGKNFFDFLVPESDRPHVDSVVKSLLEGHLPSHSINYNLTKDGKTILCEWNNAILRDSDGEIMGAMSMALDITERRQAEEARDRLNKELETKNKELESILYVASHDLKSPLVNIEGFSGELSRSCDSIRSVLREKGVESNLDKDARAALNDGIPEALGFIASANKMDSLLSGLLRLSRLGQAAIKIEPLDMNAMMSGITGSMEYQIKQTGATVKIGTLPSCLGDASQINQVFSNLLDNAINCLDISRRGAIQVYGSSEGNMSIYCVEDNGMGIAAEYYEKIFEIFQQLDPGQRSGEGLGLTIVRRILDRHNGKIWLESEVGKGSRFFVSLPSA
jgi:PAS domain S-box-containing protein